MRQQRLSIFAAMLVQRAFPQYLFLAVAQQLDITSEALRERGTLPLLQQPAIPGVYFRGAPDRVPLCLLAPGPRKSQRRATLRTGDNERTSRFNRSDDRSIKAGRARTLLLLLEAARGVHHARVCLRQRGSVMPRSP